jgi:hypothetical protein
VKTYSLSHLSDDELRHKFAEVMAKSRASTARVLADLAEIDLRGLYRSAGYPSMELYCEHELHIDEDEVPAHIQVARAARQFRAIFQSIAEGRFDLGHVVMLIPYLTSETADDLLALAANKTQAQIAHMLFQRYPERGMPTWAHAVDPDDDQLADGLVEPSERTLSGES